VYLPCPCLYRGRGRGIPSANLLEIVFLDTWKKFATSCPADSLMKKKVY